jgi:hypothetical protein
MLAAQVVLRLLQCLLCYGIRMDYVVVVLQHKEFVYHQFTLHAASIHAYPTKLLTLV